MCIDRSVVPGGRGDLQRRPGGASAAARPPPPRARAGASSATRPATRPASARCGSGRTAGIGSRRRRRWISWTSRVGPTFEPAVGAGGAEPRRREDTRRRNFARTFARNFGAASETRLDRPNRVPPIACSDLNACCRSAIRVDARSSVREPWCSTPAVAGERPASSSSSSPSSPRAVGTATAARTCCRRLPPTTSHRTAPSSPPRIHPRRAGPRGRTAGASSSGRASAGGAPRRRTRPTSWRARRARTTDDGAPVPVPRPRPRRGARARSAAPSPAPLAAVAAR